MRTDDALAAFQAALVALLAQDLPVEEVQRRLRHDPAFERFRDYVDSFEPRMIEVAAGLVKKWKDAP